MNNESTWAIAHRGASADCPENTLAAFDEALLQGCDGIELDLQLSRDGVPVVFHDKTLALAGRRQLRVAQADYAELSRLDVGSHRDKRFRDERIPLLEDVLDRYGKRTRLLLEIKTREGAAGRQRHLELARAAARSVRRRGLEENAYFLCFDTGVLDTCAKEAPQVGRVLNLKPPPLFGGTLRDCTASLWALSVDVRTLTPKFGAGADRAGVRLLVFTCNTARRVKRALAVGARGIMSDHPGWLSEQLRSGPGADGT